MQRRDMLEWLAGTGGLAALGQFSVRDLERLGQAVNATLAAQQRRTLTPAQAAMVTAAAERIIPRTDTPGATDADVTSFVDVMLTDWYSDTERRRFVEGLPALDVAAQAAHGVAFVRCTAAQQTAIVAAFDAEVDATRRTNAAEANAHWFGMLKYLTVFGYCTSQPGMTQLLRAWPPPMRYDPAAPLGGR
jgi:FtsP/CotA-like multicopper oxidase with cupredoxin domain